MNERNDLLQLPRGWVWTRLEDCVEILDGKRVPINAEEREKRNAGKLESQLFPYYGATGQVGWIDDFLFDEELLLLGEDGAPFFEPTKHKAYIIKGKTWINNHAHVLRARYGLTLNTLLCQYLNVFDYHDYVTGTTRPKLPQAPLKKIPVPLPPLAEQHRIVAKIEELFSDLDAGVAALQKARAQLKRYRQAVLKAAVEGRLTAEWRAENAGKVEPASSLLERIRSRQDAKAQSKKALASVNAAELGALPEGWCWITVEEIGEVSGGLTKNQKRIKLPFQMPYLRVANVYAGRLQLDEIKTIGVHKSEIEKLLLRKGDLLVVEGNGSQDQIGRVALWDGSISPCLHQNHIIKVRFNAVEIGKLVLLWLLSVEGRRRIVANSSSTSGLYTLSISKVSVLPVPLPPLAEQQQIVAEVERRLSVADAVEKTVDASLKQAERLRQSILKRAFAGKLVPQDPSDEPAEKLLERIASRKDAKDAKKDKV